MGTNYSGAPQALLDDVIAVIRQGVMAEMQAAEKKNSAKSPQPRLMTAAQAGEYIGRTESAIRQLIHKRQIPIVRFGRNVRVDVRDLDNLIEEYKQ